MAGIMYKDYDYYACVIGAGAGGLEVAKGLAALGKRVLLVEKGPYGGDTANFSSIPSKALIASANVAHEVYRSSLFGIDMRISNFQSNRVLDRVRRIVEEAKGQNTPEMLKAHGIETWGSSARFVDAHTIEVTNSEGEKKKISAKEIVIATGSLPRLPIIRGLDEISYHTNQTIFTLKEIPISLAIIGSGQIGCELAQAFRRLGSSVILIEQTDFLLKDEEPEAIRAVQSALVKEGVEIYLGNEVLRLRKEGDKISLHIKRKSDEKEYQLFAHQLLLATGRVAHVKDLNLEGAQVSYSDSGIKVDAYGRTDAKNIWVVGDALGGPYYTHAAVNQARTIIYNMVVPMCVSNLFGKKLVEKDFIPRAIFTDPEVASIGLTEKEAIERFGTKGIAVYKVPLQESARALCQERSDGFVKFITKKYSSKILGATIVSPIAADMLLEISCAMKEGVPLRKLAHLVHPFPTYSEIIQKAAQKWFSETILPIFRKFFRQK